MPTGFQQHRKEFKSGGRQTLREGAQVGGMGIGIRVPEAFTYKHKNFK